MATAPLNGTKTHPLSAYALDVLRWIAEEPRPRQEVNPGVANRFDREGLTEDVDLPSPYKTHRGSPIAHLRITPSGRAALAQEPRR